LEGRKLREKKEVYCFKEVRENRRERGRDNIDGVLHKIMIHDGGYAGEAQRFGCKMERYEGLKGNSGGIKNGGQKKF